MRITLNDIAKEAGVSRGTVDRALNNRGRIQPEVAERIRKIASELGYIPNASARVLAMTRTHYKVGVILQMAETPFIQDVLHGIQAAAVDLREVGLSVEIIEIQGYDPCKAVSEMRKLAAGSVKVIVLTGSEDTSLRQEIDTCKKAGIVVATVNSDLPNSHRKYFVGQNAFRAGQTAACLMADLLGGRGTISIFYGMDTTIYMERVRGFRDVISHQYPGLKISRIFRTENDPSLFSKISQEQLHGWHRKDAPDGIYLCAEGTDLLSGILREQGCSSSIRVVAHDLAGCKIDDLRDHTIDYVIDEDGYGQGFQALQILFQWYCYKQPPTREHYYSEIRIINAYNYDSYLNKREDKPIADAQAAPE